MGGGRVERCSCERAHATALLLCRVGVAQELQGLVEKQSQQRAAWLTGGSPPASPLLPAASSPAAAAAAAASCQQCCVRRGRSPCPGSSSPVLGLRDLAQAQNAALRVRLEAATTRLVELEAAVGMWQQAAACASEGLPQVRGAGSIPLEWW